MRLHPNAKTTPASRSLLVRRVLHQRWSVSETAHAFGVSPRTVYKWLQRYRAEGECQGSRACPDDERVRDRGRAAREMQPLAVGVADDAAAQAQL